MLRAFDHRVATCCGMLAVAGSSLKLDKFEPTTPNTSQHIATTWPNARNMLRPTMLQYVALACCDRLAGALISKTMAVHVRSNYWFICRSATSNEQFPRLLTTGQNYCYFFFCFEFLFGAERMRSIFSRGTF